MIKTAFITGGTSGIGRATIEMLKDNGWQIIAPTHQELNLRDPLELVNYTNKVVASLENLDAFIHIAGVWHNDDEALADKAFGSYNSGQIIEAMNVGVTSAMVLMNAFRPIMKNSTMVGISGTFNSGAKGWVPYYTSKRALEDFLVGLSCDEIDLRVYGISPSDTATEAYKKYYPEYFDEAQPPSKIAELILSLLNNESDFSSGNIIELRDGKTKIAFHS